MIRETSCYLPRNRKPSPLTSKPHLITSPTSPYIRAFFLMHVSPSDIFSSLPSMSKGPIRQHQILFAKPCLASDPRCCSPALIGTVASLEHDSRSPNVSVLLSNQHGLQKLKIYLMFDTQSQTEIYLFIPWNLHQCGISCVSFVQSFSSTSDLKHMLG